MSVVPFQSEHFWAIEPQPAQAYVAKYVSREMIDGLQAQNSFTYLNAGRPMMCFGWIPLYAHRASVWAYISKDAGSCFVAITRIAKNLFKDLRFRRLEFEVDCEFEQGHRWARMLGFTLEAERLRGYRMDGGDSAVYARIQ